MTDWWDMMNWKSVLIGTVIISVAVEGDAISG